MSGTPVRIRDSGKDLMLVSSYICKELNGTYVYSCCYDLINMLLKGIIVILYAPSAITLLTFDC